jgi:hypothetical protein
VLLDMRNSDSLRDWRRDVISAEVNGHVLNGLRSEVVNTSITSKTNMRFVIKLEVNINISSKRNQQIASIDWNIGDVNLFKTLHGAGGGFSGVAFTSDVNDGLDALTLVVTVKAWVGLTRRKSDCSSSCRSFGLT